MGSYMYSYVYKVQKQKAVQLSRCLFKETFQTFYRVQTDLTTTKERFKLR